MAARVVSKREAAELLSVSERTVDRLIARGLLRATKVGRLVRVFVSSIDRFLGREVES